MKRPDTSQVLAALRPLRIPLILLALYLALHAVMTALSVRHGYGSPDGLGLGSLAVAAAVVVLRVALLIVVSAVLAFRLVVCVLAQFIAKPSVEKVNPFPEASSRHDTPESRAVQVKPSADRDVL
ncbi:hypothetical protein J2W56_003133 [Nocardia kruczakiae]|uniref:Uncharacterized protein n=1 Tax=Nocardia kruczakiae TaxID=261477 RepID=A0ABU1XHD5_9NOCA|nr:hypothetical protein [Nocardia kruczakiae]MDR7169392.1 hypothetical protein [Nocardia kruczakiae]